MELVNHIDKIKVNQIKDDQCIVFIGYAFDKQGDELEYELLVNGELCSLRKSNMMRKDVATRFPKYNLSPKCGFYIKSESIVKEIYSVELIAKNEKDKQTIVSLNGNAVKKHISTKSVEYNVDSVTWETNDNFKCVIRGYAFSLVKGKDLSFSIVDNKNRKIESSHIMNNREDIYKLFMLEENEKYCGFEVKFMGEEKANYKLIISNGEDEVKCDI